MTNDDLVCIDFEPQDTASKMAIEGFTGSLAFELEPFNVLRETGGAGLRSDDALYEQRVGALALAQVEVKLRPERWLLLNQLDRFTLARP